MINEIVDEVIREEMNERTEFIRIFKRERPKHAARAEELYDTLVRHSKQLHKLAEHACNRELTAREEARDAQLETVVRALCAEVDIRAKFNGDPRGYAVKLHFGPTPESQPGNTWGGNEDGWGIG